MHSLGKTLLAFSLIHFVLQGQICLLLQVFLLTSYFCIPVPYNEKDIFFFSVLVVEGLVGLQRTVQLQPLQHYCFRVQTWITVILNGLPWKLTEIILLLLRLHPSTAFQTLLLTMMATPFLLRDSCPQQQIQWSSVLNSSIPVYLSLLIPRIIGKKPEFNHVCFFEVV